uniref:PKW1 plasmid n=1 Tax=Kluyveromyces waltii TaxID=4914 RepID=Q01110_KLUWA|nr:unnamed protein product [Lachancea waltii]
MQSSSSDEDDLIDPIIHPKSFYRAANEIPRDFLVAIPISAYVFSVFAKSVRDDLQGHLTARDMALAYRERQYFHRRWETRNDQLEIPDWSEIPEWSLGLLDRPPCITVDLARELRELSQKWIGAFDLGSKMSGRLLLQLLYTQLSCPNEAVFNKLYCLVKLLNKDVNRADRALMDSVLRPLFVENPYMGELDEEILDKIWSNLTEMRSQEWKRIAEALSGENNDIDCQQQGFARMSLVDTM